MRDAPKTIRRPFHGFDTSTAKAGSGALIAVGALPAYRRPEHADQPSHVAAAVAALRRGRPTRKVYGVVTCRLCGATLGADVLTLGRWEWLEGSEHYVEAHGLWPPLLTSLVEYVNPRALAPVEDRHGPGRGRA